MKMTAKTLAGLEEVLARELEALGAKEITLLKRAVAFEGDKRLMYRANLELRTALRILLPLRVFTVNNEDMLYTRIRSIDWGQFMRVQDTLAIDAVVTSYEFRNSHYVALKAKDAIADRFRNDTGRRPHVNTHSPDLRINIHILRNDCTVSLDSSGDSLHKRGYRIDSGEAPINEVLAAGMIQLSGWQRDSVFIDPMCGSGTLPIEAASWAYDRAPQLSRKDFGFMHWPDYEPELWQSVLEEAKGRWRQFDHQVYGFDKDFRVRRIALHNAEAAGLSDQIQLERKPFERLKAPADKGLLMMNPPYDERLEEEDILSFYKMIGDRLKKEFTGYDAWLISSNAEALNRIGLKVSSKTTLFNGPLECRFHHYELYRGSKEA